MKKELIEKISKLSELVDFSTSKSGSKSSVEEKNLTTDDAPSTFSWDWRNIVKNKTIKDGIMYIAFMVLWALIIWWLTFLYFDDIRSIDVNSNSIEYLTKEFNSLDNKVEVKMEVMNDRLELLKD